MAVLVMWRARSQAIRDHGGPSVPTSMLLGSARSGTTWLGEVLDRHRDHRILFEPLRPGVTPSLDVLKQTPSVALGSSADVAGEGAFRELVEGRLRDPWTDHLNRAWRPRRRLIKEVRGNALVPWMAARFPEVPIVLVVRHPVAVVDSRTTLGWPDQLAWYLDDEHLVRAVPDDAVEAVRALRDPWRRAVAQWMFETWVPLAATEAPNLFVASYEVLQEDRAAVRRVLEHVGQRWDDDVEAALARRSRTTVTRSPTASRRPRPDPDALSFVDELLVAFGLSGHFSASVSKPLRPLGESHPPVASP